MQNFQKQLILALLGYAVKRNLDPDQICRLSGIDNKLLIPNKRSIVSPQQFESLWKNLTHLSNDPLFGLHFGESMQLAALGVVGQVIQTSSNVKDALINAGGLVGLVTDMFSMQMEEGKKSISIRLIHDSNQAKQLPFTFRNMADYLAVFIVHELDGLLLEKIQPLSVQVPFAVSETQEYARVMRCSIRQNAKELSIELRKKNLSLPIISANYELQNYLLQKINLLSRENGEEKGLSHKIFNYLLSNSYLYNMSLDAVAANFNMSARTLQRKLKEEGISFLQIVDKVRRKLAVFYLSSGNYPVKDIAYVLGYNEQAAFIRAFKRWTGKTPTAYQLQSKYKTSSALT
jgi:AraC-like DNA-binding protein